MVRRLQAGLNIPVFHDDQHGTAIVVLAGLLNACRVTKRPLDAGAWCCSAWARQATLSAGVARRGVADDERTVSIVIPSLFHASVHRRVAQAVVDAVRSTSAS